MSAFDNVTISNRTPGDYINAIKAAESKGRSFALEEVADKCVALNVEVKEISLKEAGLVKQDHFEMSEFDPRETISDLFGVYSEQLYNVEWYYDQPTLPILNNVGYGVRQMGFNEDSIAQIAAEVGMRIDQIYKNGRYTDDEYRQLNEEIEYGVKQWVDRLYSCRASMRMDKFGYNYRDFDKIKQQLLRDDPPDFDGIFALIEQIRNRGVSSVNPRRGKPVIWS